VTVHAPGISALVSLCGAKDAYSSTMRRDVTCPRCKKILDVQRDSKAVKP